MAGEKYDYKQLFAEYPDLKTWYDNQFNSSPAMAEDRLRRIGYVCRVYHTSRAKLAKLSSKAGHGLIVNIITDLHKQSKSSEYMKGYVKALKSWLLYNQIKIEQKISIPIGKKTTKVQQEQSPTPDQLSKLLDHAELKAKLECALVAFSGIRIEVMGDFLGTDGLRVKDFPELQVQSETVTFAKVPTMIVVRPNIS